MLISLFPCFTFLLANSGTAFAQTATVDAAISRGTPANLASGWIYGIPDTPGQIPDHFYSDVGYRYGRAGGAQLVNPGERGWIWGMNEYKVCRTTLSEFANRWLMDAQESIRIGAF